MASRQRNRPSRTPSAVPSPVLSGDQLSGSYDSAAQTDSAKASALLRASFDTQPYESSSADAAEVAAPQATFVGERLIYKDRDARIAEAAYLRAQERGFTPGSELDDWLAAEKEIDALLSSDGNADAR
jgi:Protein of unknown function (DUF2934)